AARRPKADRMTKRQPQPRRSDATCSFPPLNPITLSTATSTRKHPAMNSRGTPARTLIPLLALLVWVPSVVAQEQSVNPGINKQFENPKVADFVPRFDRDGREPYDHRFEIIKAVSLKPGMVVADVGAGTGLFTLLFAPLVAPQGRVYAVDLAENFVQHIERQAQAEGITNIKGVVCTPDSVNLPPESIDLAFLCDVYHHFEFPHKTMRSIHRALKPGGSLVLIDFHRIAG